MSDKPEARYLWEPRVLTQLGNTDTPTHSFFTGASGSGKTYAINKLIESLFPTKEEIKNSMSPFSHKFFLLNVYSKELLQDVLSLIFFDRSVTKIYEGKELNKKMDDRTHKVESPPLPKPIKMRVFVPLTLKDLPDKLPVIFQPFTIPITDLDQSCMQALYGSVDTQKAFSIYSSIVQHTKKETGILMFKEKLRKRQKATHLMENIGHGIRVPIYDTAASFKTIGGLQDRLNKFYDTGVLSSEKNPFCLKNFLREDMRDPQTVSVLDTSRIKSDEIKFFCLIYFLKAIQDVVREIGVTKLNYKVATVFDEGKNLFRKADKAGGLDRAISQKLNDFSTDARHSKIEIWFSTQSPQYLDKEANVNWKVKMIFDFNNNEDYEWFMKHYPSQASIFKIDHLKETFNRMRTLRQFGDYRFLLVGADLTEQLVGRGGSSDYSYYDFAYSFRYPRMNCFVRRTKRDGQNKVEYKVPLEEDNYRTLFGRLKEDDYLLSKKDVFWNADFRVAKVAWYAEVKREAELLRVLQEKERARHKSEEEKKELVEDRIVRSVAHWIRRLGDKATITMIGRKMGKTKEFVAKRWERALALTAEDGVKT